ncbi:MAG TPA: selenide, water dikinase SelD, partial [Vicinamibacteria bacterium]|nr:selenide, water dikinase SelD [Vicinamibacteria bacterium]
LGGLTPTDDPRVLVDHRTGDDAGVFRIDERTTLVQTVDFFTPVVDDPQAFGMIAAANALSDVYAMGGRPLTALSIAAIPEKDFPVEWTAAIFQGGLLKLQEAGCVLLGGHTVRDPEIKFGYAITGLVDPDRMMTNAAARAGDTLVLTKPLGTGVIATALKASHAPAEAVEAATRAMATLNRIPAAVATRLGVRAATDVTGFGLLGHALNLARESGVTLEIDGSHLPLLPGALDVALRFQPGGLKSNRRQFAPAVTVEGALEPAREALLYDPQTSGGLLLSVPAAAREALLHELPHAAVIGRVLPRGETPLAVRA